MKEAGKDKRIYEVIEKEIMSCEYLKKEKELIINGISYLEIIKIYSSFNVSTVPVIDVNEIYIEGDESEMSNNLYTEDDSKTQGKYTIDDINKMIKTEEKERLNKPDPQLQKIKDALNENEFIKEEQKQMEIELTQRKEFKRKINELINQYIQNTDNLKINNETDNQKVINQLPEKEKEQELINKDKESFEVKEEKPQKIKTKDEIKPKKIQKKGLTSIKNVQKIRKHNLRPRIQSSKAVDFIDEIQINRVSDSKELMKKFGNLGKETDRK
ncbi:viral a-type inclusion protein repeat containing protein, putative [Entamoeba histolytica HM-1:IMSS-B]|uniref:Uncharacterized protein n=6 Tax=Entamoeba histolytica TaxID=5759 RepID=C4M0X7_ENTH1|nr:hypothetical protein EHI_015400 [Entamoeba histolytica HM-1:IMSS]EMD48714.1 Hypothetical protein EHI5A_095730 [Entamoeba histolytica KU27]EMH72847.1 viral a-type inclusion protein repeat containing protein, putative [Entamoeba histolytica HM-1:IMSS-B]EMS12970.1 hypothetical protein KM1_121460 [Entamoeba histolytica HM-3:IMSS]ENY62876.1 hypothetical protein EHI7A_070450 [Entamoeba histolytica HM-1:IMSS-A]GAT94832.1 hypothetical protein CL6EHI_015400 [Entamoeba histolytica]|eukprot:XP_654485.1 hypothetical protein EHI_015400 [Entamoeba histolytica HM-1:IMSS]